MPPEYSDMTERMLEQSRSRPRLQPSLSNPEDYLRPVVKLVAALDTKLSALRSEVEELRRENQALKAQLEDSAESKDK
ncbi:hypothetical protein BKA81DRAFT_349838 [Phyllosticta paracitricarpa]